MSRACAWSYTEGGSGKQPRLVRPFHRRARSRNFGRGQSCSRPCQCWMSWRWGGPPRGGRVPHRTRGGPILVSASNSTPERGLSPAEGARCCAGAASQSPGGQRHDGTDAPRNLWLLWWNVPRGTGTNGRDGRRSGARREPIAAVRHTVGENVSRGLFTIMEKGRRGRCARAVRRCAGVVPRSARRKPARLLHSPQVSGGLQSPFSPAKNGHDALPRPPDSPPTAPSSRRGPVFCSGTDSTHPAGDDHI
jgi:hypothetical protein